LIHWQEWQGYGQCYESMTWRIVGQKMDPLNAREPE
jgi:hypothetical protein